MNYHKGLVTDLKSQKENLESVLTMKTQDVRKNLTNVSNIENIMGEVRN